MIIFAEAGLSELSHQEQAIYAVLAMLAPLALPVGLIVSAFVIYRIIAKQFKNESKEK